jgi:hypothetical protein
VLVASYKCRRFLTVSDQEKKNYFKCFLLELYYRTLFFTVINKEIYSIVEKIINLFKFSFSAGGNRKYCHFCLPRAIVCTRQGWTNRNIANVATADSD